MSSRVMMVDVDKFSALVDAKIAEYTALGNAVSGKDNLLAAYYCSVGKAMFELSHCMIKSSTIEKWD